ncbi:hypothetical protein ACA910_020513 [Epithemia clementina (nom. ined.)]
MSAAAAAAAAAAGSSSSGRDICVIGAGAAGLVTARHLLRCGLRPTILEAAPDLGGLWSSPNRPNKKTWKSLRTNLSRYTCCFSEHPWSNNHMDNLEQDARSFFFPTAWQMHQYLSSYAQQFLYSHEDCTFGFGCQVTKVRPHTNNNKNKDQGYSVEWTTTTTTSTPTTTTTKADESPSTTQTQSEQIQHHHQRIFDGVVVASGFFAQAAWPSGVVVDDPTNTRGGGGNSNTPPPPPPPPPPPFFLLHSSQYQSADQLWFPPQTFVKATATATATATPVLDNNNNNNNRHNDQDNPDPKNATPKTVAICGSSFSAFEIAVDLCKSSSASSSSLLQTYDAPCRVLHILPQWPWILPRFVPDATRRHGWSPIDLVLYQRPHDGFKLEQVLGNDPDANAQKRDFLSQLLGRPQLEKQQGIFQHQQQQQQQQDQQQQEHGDGDSSSNQKDHRPSPPGGGGGGNEDDTTLPVFCSITDEYWDWVSRGRIQIESGYYWKGWNEEGQLLLEPFEPAQTTKSTHENNTSTTTTTLTRPVNAVIAATGYHTTVDAFLDHDTILSKLQFQPHNQFMPLVLCHDVYHPELPRLALVGMYRGPYFGVLELQARLAAAQLAIQLLLPPKQKNKENDDDSNPNDGDNDDDDDDDDDDDNDAKELQTAQLIRDQVPQPQFPRGDLIGRMDALTTKLYQLGRRYQHVLPNLHGFFNNDDDNNNNNHNDHNTDKDNEPLVPLFRTKGTVVLPALYQPNVTLAQSVLDDLERNLEQKCRNDPRFITSMVWTALVGTVWNFERSLTPVVGSRDGTGLPMGSSQSVSGTIRFSLQQDNHTVNPNEVYLLYREDGVMSLPSGKPMSVFREYHYVQNTQSGALDLYFVEQGKRAHLFLSLVFEPQVPSPESPTPLLHQNNNHHNTNGSMVQVWTARSNHLCVKDMYNAHFAMEFNGLAAQRLAMEYTVQGPAKDYISKTILTPASSSSSFSHI